MKRPVAYFYALQDFPLSWAQRWWRRWWEDANDPMERRQMQACVWATSADAALMTPEQTFIHKSRQRMWLLNRGFGCFSALLILGEIKDKNNLSGWTNATIPCKATSVTLFNCNQVFNRIIMLGKIITMIWFCPKTCIGLNSFSFFLNIIPTNHNKSNTTQKISSWEVWNQIAKC